ncbi:UBP1-associated protein 2C-like [Phoenix dactylifera]|uniref:UBP1-associated protein 2C-like n=1 Tax=Phoenix dactylifera TaxID=42345 RepID=A0A8B7BIB4_PHODC|nr:UBP1-associated protein 2C-like [Phoenix dactylifera]
MEEAKKRKLEETGNGDVFSPQSEGQLRNLLDPLRKDQLVDLLVKLGTQYSTVAEEIKGVACSDPVHRKLFVRGLAWETTSETLCAAFSMHGEIEEGAVIFDKATGKSRGYGFITFRHMESAQKALQEPSKMIDGRLAVCNLACESLSSASVSTDVALRKIYIGGLSPDISSETLLSFFGRHGDIEEGSVAYDKDTNKSRGFGFVTYKTAEAAKKAIDDPNKTLGGRNITVKLADTHKSKVIQAQVPAAMVPMAVPFPAGFAQSGKSQSASPSPVGYAPYLPAMSAYPTAYPNAPAQYASPPQISYPQVGGKKEPVGLPSAAPPGIPGYPYYATKP